MRVLVTGANGFIGKNFLLHLEEKGNIDVIPFTRKNDVNDLFIMLEDIDWVFHLAGTNRPKNREEFMIDNSVLTQKLCSAIKACPKVVPVVYTSSIQAELDNDYGISKRAAEESLLMLQRKTNNPVFIYRLPNVFGKWARPNYNSVVATFCYNLARELPIKIDDSSSVINLAYVDDVVDSFMSLLVSPESISKAIGTTYINITPEYEISVGELADQIKRFKETRNNLVTEAVGSGLLRALHSTYLSYLPPSLFTYKLKQHSDSRGIFVEMLKTKEYGQFSFFTAHPNVTRGGHYHHSKTEKFLVIKGKACFRFRHMITKEYYELHTSDNQLEIVETVPGWAHDVTNVGDSELICMLWASEIFENDKPDTFTRLLD